MPDKTLTKIVINISHLSQRARNMQKEREKENRTDSLNPFPSPLGSDYLQFVSVCPLKWPPGNLWSLVKISLNTKAISAQFFRQMDQSESRLFAQVLVEDRRETEADDAARQWATCSARTVVTGHGTSPLPRPACCMLAINCTRAELFRNVVLMEAKMHKRMSDKNCIRQRYLYREFEN